MLAYVNKLKYVLQTKFFFGRKLLVYLCITVAATYDRIAKIMIQHFC